MTRAKDAILQDLAREEQRLAELERTRDEARARIEWLRSELATASAPAPLSLRLPLAKLVNGVCQTRPDTEHRAVLVGARLRCAMLRRNSSECGF
jgi:hypothetical protein